MKYDFNQMEESMDMLAKNMDSITSFSDQISSTLQSTRHQIVRLSSVHTLLKKLQFLFKLPNNLKDRINEENYSQVSLYFLLVYNKQICIWVKLIFVFNYFRLYRIISMRREY